MRGRIKPLTAPGRRPPAGPSFGEGGQRLFISNAQLAILLVIAGETMIFGGLIGGLVVFKAEAAFWPPPNLPRLPIFSTAINTIVLLASAVTMYLAMRAVRQSRQRVLRRRLLVTGVLGITFLAVQGKEWVRLIAHGLKLSSGTYGGIFYTLIGFHGLHVTVATIWLAVIAILAWRGRYNARNTSAVELCAMYWYFVCAVWPVLFVLVYLT